MLWQGRGRQWGLSGKAVIEKTLGDVKEMVCEPWTYMMGLGQRGDCLGRGKTKFKSLGVEALEMVKGEQCAQSFFVCFKISALATELW